MEAGTPQQLAVPTKWTKANLAREAGVHVATIHAKNDDGSYRCAATLEALKRCGQTLARLAATGDRRPKRSKKSVKSDARRS